MEHQTCVNMIADTDTNQLSFSSRQKQAKTSKKYSLPIHVKMKGQGLSQIDVLIDSGNELSHV